MRRRFGHEEALFTPSFICICCANLLFFVAGFMMIPVLPLYLLDSLHASKSMVGIVLSAYMAGALFLRPFSGFMVDQFQRKPLFILFAALFVMPFGGYLLAKTLFLIGFIRAVHGMCFGMLTTSSTTLAVDIMPLDKLGTGIGIYGMMTSLAMALGPMVGMMVLESASYNGVFGVASGCASGGLLLGLMVKGKRVAVSRGEKLSLDRFFLKKGTWAFIGLILMGFVYGLLINYLSMVARERGIETNAGYFFMLMSVGLILSRFFAGNLIDKGYIACLILGGKTLIAGAMAAFLFVPSEMVFFGSAVVFGLGYGMMSPSYQTLFIRLAEPTRRGTANSTYLVGWDVGIGLAVLLGGVIADLTSLDTSFLLSFAFLFLSAVLFLKITLPHYKKNTLS